MLVCEAIEAAPDEVRRRQEGSGCVPISGGVTITCQRAGCTTSFVHRRGVSRRFVKYCSDDCKRAAAKELHLEKEFVTCIRPGCGKHFRPRRRGKVEKERALSNGRYCSVACHTADLGNKRRIHQTQREQRDAWWVNDQIRRAIKAGVEYESFTRREIFERDKWVCGICKEAVDPDAHWPNVMCATVDHIIPIAAKGPHLRSNAQCSHWICNSKKTFLVDPKELIADDGECPAIEEIANRHASKVRSDGRAAQTG